MGLNSHSEIGWVMREYDNLINNALKLGIKEPDSYYVQGKIKGKKSKEDKIDAPKTPEKASVSGRKFHVSDARIDPFIEEEPAELFTPSKKPTLNDLPNFVKHIGASEIPDLFKGFKPSRRK